MRTSLLLVILWCVNRTCLSSRCDSHLRYKVTGPLWKQSTCNYAFDCKHIGRHFGRTVRILERSLKMPHHAANLSEQGQWRWSAFSERKALNLLKFWMHSLLITLRHVYQGKQWTCSLCFQRADSERWRCHDRERRTLALTRRVQTAEHENGRRTDRSLSMELNLSVGTVHAIAWDLRQHMMFPLGPTSTDIHTHVWAITCHYHRNMYSCTILVTRFWGELLTAVRHGVTTLNARKNHQACNGDTAIHHDRRNPRYKHPPLKLC